MTDTIPVTRADLLKTAGAALQAQARLREVMAGVAAEVAAGKTQGASPAPAKDSGQ